MAGYLWLKAFPIERFLDVEDQIAALAERIRVFGIKLAVPDKVAKLFKHGQGIPK